MLQKVLRSDKRLLADHPGRAPEWVPWSKDDDMIGILVEI
jgi:hypothetical protein